MKKIGTILLNDNAFSRLAALRDKLSSVAIALQWLAHQRFDSANVREALDDVRREAESEKADWVRSIREEAKHLFPEGKKMALSYNKKEVDIYG